MKTLSVGNKEVSSGKQDGTSHETSTDAGDGGQHS